MEKWKQERIWTEKNGDRGSDGVTSVTLIKQYVYIRTNFQKLPNYSSIYEQNSFASIVVTENFKATQVSVVERSRQVL